jgi:hypothetical protein
MHNTLDIPQLRKFSILLKANESKFTISNERKLLFTGDISAIAQLFRDVSVEYVKDADGYILDLKALAQNYKIIYYK